MNKAEIVKGGLYEASNQNSTLDVARVIDVDNGIVIYEHISRIKVKLYDAIDSFAELWVLKDSKE